MVWKKEMKKAPLPETSELMQTDCEQELITWSQWLLSVLCTFVYVLFYFDWDFDFDFDFAANLEHLVSPNQSAKSTDLKMVFFLSFNDI